MEPLKFIVIGSGWRSLFYHRIAKAYPEHFKLMALVCRTEEKAEHLRREYGIKAVTSGKEGLEERPVIWETLIWSTFQRSMITMQPVS